MMRSASLDGYLPLARSFGIEPLMLMDRVGISRNCLNNPDLKLSISAYCRLLELSAQAAKADDFGVRLAETRQLSTLGPVGLVVREQPTVRRAIGALVDNIRLHNESAWLALEEAGEVVVVRPELAVARGVPAVQARDMVLGVVCRILTLLLGPRWRPQSVSFVRAKPGTLAAHWRVFGQRLDFEQDFNGIVCLRSDIDQPIAGADPGLAREAARYVALLGADTKPNPLDEVRRIALTLMPEGQCSVERVAQHLGVDRRTIHRHLAAHQASFSSMMEDLRDELATTYIDQSARPLSLVAGLLGFSGQSAFSH